MKLIRILGWDTVRAYCVRNSLYTNGCNQEYTALYEYITERKYRIDDEALLYIAEDIYKHSITDLYLEDIYSGLNRESYYQIA